jgi:hypothetical protein
MALSFIHSILVMLETLNAVFSKLTNLVNFVAYGKIILEWILGIRVGTYGLDTSGSG